MDAELDELGVDLCGACNVETTVLKGRPRGALVKHLVLKHAEVLQAVPLCAGLGVLRRMGPWIRLSSHSIQGDKRTM